MSSQIRLLLLVIALTLAFGGLPVAHAEEEPQPAGLESTIYSATASGPDGSWISVRVFWNDMPTRLGLPTHNADRTFYPGDALRVQVHGSRTGWYEDRVIYYGVVATGQVGAGESFDQKLDLQIATSTDPGLREINFALSPRKGTVDILTVDEYGNFRTRQIYINGQFAGVGQVSWDLEQGTYTISFEPAPENVLAPSATTVTVTPGRRVRVVAFYAPVSAPHAVRTTVRVEEEGAPSSLPWITTSLRLCVVPYNPRFVVFPYLWMNWRQDSEAPQDSYELPFAVLVRYDGNQFDPENEDRLSLDQRALVDGVSMEGSASWALRAYGEQQRYHDNGDLAYHENGDPVMYEDWDEVSHDIGTPKFETARVGVISDPMMPGGFFTLTAQYQKSENAWEEFYSHEELFGHGPFNWLHFRDVQVAGTTKGPGDRIIYELLAADGKPIVFDSDYRYHKFVFGLWPQARDWVAAGKGTLALDLSLWSLDAEPKKTIETEIGWDSFGLSQPVAVRAWRLAPWARDVVDEDPQVLYLDDAWMIDGRVGFETNFVPVSNVENFLYMARRFAESVPFLDEYFEESGLLEKDMEVLLPILEKMGIEQSELPALRDAAPATRSVLYTLASLDDNMMHTIVEDIGTGDAQPQRISGAGEAHATIERRGLSVFALEERAWSAGENIRARSSMVELPFDNAAEYALDINLSGEGLAVEVVNDTTAKIELRLHAPQRSGGLRYVRIFDNWGRLLFQRDFLPSPLAHLSFLDMIGQGTSVAETPLTVALQKSPGSPTEIFVELTNHWGASRTVKVAMLPWVPAEGVGMNIWGWLVAAGAFVAAWLAFVNWLKKGKTHTAWSAV